MKLSPQAITTHRIGVTRCPPITSSPNRPIASVETRIRDQIASARRTLATYGPDFSPVSILALGSRLGYLVTFTSLHRGLCELIYSPGPKTARYSVIADRAPCPIRRHPRTATRGLTSFLTSLTSLLTSPGLGIVTLPLMTESGWLNSNLQLAIKLRQKYQNSNLNSAVDS